MSKSYKDPAADAPTIVEEKVVKTNGEVLIKKYSKGRFLGKGGFARCYEFRSLDTNRSQAAKIIPKASLTKKRAKQKLMSEIKIHRSLRQTNVVGFEHFFEDSENVYILLEMCTNQTLNELVRRRKRLTELEVQCYVMQMVGALKYLHSHRVIHRDMKLGNLFLSDKMELKIGDFGLATKLEFEGERKRTICGTPNYIAPEILDGKHGHSYEVDIWSLGVIIYTLLIGRPPFETSDVKTTYRKIRMNAYSFPEHITISDEARSLITRILHSDPARRPSLDEISDHDFFKTGSGIPKLLPASTLACGPSTSYLKQFMKDPSQIQQNKQSVQRLESTAPVTSQVRGVSSGSGNGNAEKDLRNTERVKLSGMGQDRASSREARTASRTERDSRPQTGRMDSSKKSSAISSSYKPTPGGEKNANTPDVWVKKWVDYSSKYGLGYLLSNGATGVFFNDSTKILLDTEGHKFDYMERKSSERQDMVYSHTLTNYPKELQKKVTLLQHFRSYLEGDAKKDKAATDDASAVNSKYGLVYVKKWMRTRHAIMFRLSNKIVQVNFQDHTEIILSSESRVVTYVNKKGERSTHPLNAALESTNMEMSKRLKYTKDILTHMLSANAQTHGGTGGSSSQKQLSGTGTGPLTER